MNRAGCRCCGDTSEPCRCGNVTVEDNNLTCLAFIATKPRPHLVGTQCTNRRPAEEARGLEGYRPTSGELMRCGRPVWGDGRGVLGQGEGLCSRCWHEHNAFHGTYTTMAANPAASLLSGSKIEQMSDLFGGGQSLPPVGAERPDTFPEDWL